MKKVNFILFVSVFLFFCGFTFQLFKTDLRITVRNELGNTENDVDVTLYDTREDYEKSENAVQSGKTNAKGSVTFEGLKSQVYFINAEKGDMNNYGAGEKTDTLKEGKMNKVTVIISE